MGGHPTPRCAVVCLVGVSRPWPARAATDLRAVVFVRPIAVAVLYKRQSGQCIAWPIALLLFSSAVTSLPMKSDVALRRRAFSRKAKQTSQI